MKKIYRYFIAYSFYTKSGEQGFGNMESHLYTPISGMTEIKVIQDEIKRDKPYIKQVIVLNFILIEE